MSYTSIAKVRVSSGFSDSAKIADATITTYIEGADNVVNAKVADRYNLPLAIGGEAETPDIIETLSNFLVVGLLYSNEYGEESVDTDKGWQERTDWAMDRLDEIQSGKMKLYDSNGVEFDRSTLRNPAFNPSNASSEAGAEDSDQAKFTMNKKF